MKDNQISRIIRNKRINNRDFFLIDAELLAIKLLGKIIVRKINGIEERYVIAETECYMGEHDTACHAHIGKTLRNKPMWNIGGTLYVHLIYGIHFMLNIVAGKENQPMGVLIRGVIGIKGPGLVTRALKIDKTLNEEDLLTSSRIWIEEMPDLHVFDRAMRVGIDYAKKEDREKLYRFLAYKYLNN